MVKKRVNRDIKVTVALFVMAVFFVGLISYVGYNYFKLNRIESEIGILNIEIEELKKDDNITRIREKQKLMNELKEVVNNLDGAAESIDGITNISEHLLAVIVDAVPRDVQLTTFAVQGTSITVNGVALSKPAIAEFQYNFSDSDTITNVFIPKITNEGGYYSFEANLTIGGGKSENNQS